jgi:putative heme iron utilization protein
MRSTLSPDDARTICEHMNDDHADSVVHYARTFAKLPGASVARLAAIDAEGMDIEATVGAQTVVARIAFDHVLSGVTDARETLIAMARAASAP